MAENSKCQSWLTYALTDEGVPNALTLCFSLKQVLTSRKVAVIASRNVSSEMKEALYGGFDLIIYLEEDKNSAGLQLEEFVKLFTLTLKFFDKCLFLSPSMIVIKNCDTMFDDYELSNGEFLWPEVEGLTLFGVCPCPQMFKMIMNGLETSGENGMENFLMDWSRAHYDQPKCLERKYNCCLFKNGTISGDEMNICIIDIVGIPCQSDVGEVGMLAKLILKHRDLLCKEFVQPLLLSGIAQHVYSPVRYRKEPIAIIGMSCRYPGGSNLDDFWHLLISGGDATCNPPDFRWTTQLFPGSNVADYRKTNAGFLDYPVEEFDAKFFNISRKELLFLDPQARLLHELVWEGLEDAATNPSELRGSRAGVFVGSWTNDYKSMLEKSGVGNSEFYRKYIGNSIGGSAARISFLLGLTGPSVATESGCSSGMVGVHLACRSLQQRETNFAIACGVNLLLDPFQNDLMPMMLSPEGRCKTFDTQADGFARAEGCGVLILKRFSDAVRDGDRIRALVRGSAIAQEGLSKSMGTPTVHCESLAMKKALQDARVDPKDVSYVEAHGTGTRVGDPLEIAAIAKAYNSPQRKEALYIGSVKTNIGHTESASGMAGIMKVVLSMEAELIPPHRNFDSLNPAIDLEAVPAKIPLIPVKWTRELGSPRYAGVSSFGITGTDAHTILEEAPNMLPKPLTFSNIERPLHIMKITGKSEQALDILLKRYQDHLDSTTSDWKDLAHSANTGRADFELRAIVLAKSKEEAIRKIEQKEFLRGEKTNLEKICFLFTGQGSQYPGMAKQLFETSPVFRIHFEYCQNILKSSYDIDINQILWSQEPLQSKEIKRTIYSQTSIFCVEYALLKLWESWGVKPDYVLGHSLGEFPAAVCAGILSVSDALKLVAERSRLIDELSPGKMLAINADKKRVGILLKQFSENDSTKMLDVAAVNSPNQTVLAGDPDLILRFSEYCKEAKLKCKLLEATHAFHSKHMDPMLEEYRAVANTVKPLTKRRGSSKYISGMSGLLMDAEKLDSDYWVQHTREKVEFMSGTQKAVELGCKIFLEIGPQPVLTTLIMVIEMGNRQNLRCFPSLKRNENEWETLLGSLSKLYLQGVEVDWKGLDKFYERKKQPLPHYPFIRKKFWPNMSPTTSAAGHSIHPLLGWGVPNASLTKLFQKRLDLTTLEYIRGHIIGTSIIFPGAAYLEICLAAGLASLQGATSSIAIPPRPVKVEQFLIEAPLELEEEKAVVIQTTVDYKNRGDLNVQIYRKLEAESGDCKWLSHSRAVISFATSKEETSGLAEPSTFLSIISDPCDDERTLKEIYEKMSSVGLKFGDTFRSIQKLWRGEESLIAKVKVPSLDEKSVNHHIIHPVVLDAMIQTLMMLRYTTNLKKKLLVPIKIGKFVYISGTTSTELYVQAFGLLSKDSAVLVDASGTPLALMSGVEFVETTVKGIQAVLNEQSSPLPEMWESVWRRMEGPAENRLDLSKLTSNFTSKEFEQKMEAEYNVPSQFLAQTFSELSELAYYNFLRALFELGWTPSLSQSFSEHILFTELSIDRKFVKYFGFMLQVLESEGILKKVAHHEHDITWKTINMPPPLHDLTKIFNQPEFSSNLIAKFKTISLYFKFGENLSNILRGTSSALAILFPDEKSGLSSVSDFYWEYAELFRISEFGRNLTTFRFSPVAEAIQRGNGVPKILEIGAGTGSYSENFLTALEQLNVTSFEYTYTDISSAFFPSAEKRFEKFGKKMKFKTLNIEEDPIEQGFSPEYFDYVYVAEVLHATRDIKESLRNLRMMMKPHAKLDMVEQTREHRFGTSLFGSLEGFWRFQDFELRPKHCTLSKESWACAYKEAGFGIDGIYSVLNNYHSYICVHKTPTKHLETWKGNDKYWLLFHHEGSQVSCWLKEKIEGVPGRKVMTVTEGNGFQENTDSASLRINREEDYTNLFNLIENRGNQVEGILYCWGLNKTKLTQDVILQPYFYLIKALLDFKLRQLVVPRLIVITAATNPTPGESEPSHFHSSTLWALTKSLKNEHHELNCRAIQIATAPMDRDELEAIFQEIWSCDLEVQVAFHGATRYVPRLQPHIPKNNALDLPQGTDRFQLVLSPTNAISELSFGSLDTPDNLGEEDVEVSIKASALNFRDLLSVLKPTEQFRNINSIGFDFAGEVERVGVKVRKWKLGDRVSGCNMENTALPSHVVLHQDLLLLVPDSSSFCEAATIPAVYVTSVLCLLEVAKIKKEDVVLIHTATGGVGLSAIEICKRVGCTIVATAGSKRKQNYLRGLGLQHIFHSRNTNYGDEILRATNGRGVNVVLNSLTSEGFKETTLRACAQGARFVEMSKLNIWTKEEVAELRPDVEYTIADVSSAKQSDWHRLLEVVRSLMETKTVKPIPYVRFDGLNIREALYYMEKAKHVGKIVCAMPDWRSGEKGVEAHTPLFNDSGSYLITGGLGGIGFVVCQWMVKMGAKNVMLASRSLPQPSILAKIKEMNSRGARVIPVQVDVSDFEQCRELLGSGMGRIGFLPLSGVMHAAGVLKDGMIENQDWSSFSSNFPPKIQGTLNLHKLSLGLSHPLEHFIVFSSTAALYGPPGQGNHAAANKFQDNLIHYRNSIGLPGMSVNWGQWGEVGVATEIDIPGIKTISNLQGIRGLEYAIKSQMEQIAIVNVESFGLFSKIVPYLATYLDERVWKKRSTPPAVNNTAGFKPEELWELYQRQSSLDEKYILLKEQIGLILRVTLKLEHNEKLDEQSTLQELGVDSLMFVEIKNCLQVLLGDRLTISANLLKDSTNVTTLSQSLVQLIEGPHTPNQLPQRPTTEQVNNLIKEDCQLPIHIRGQSDQHAEIIGNVRTVFLTGCSGTFGPYVLRGLTANPQISEVVCLMRPTKGELVESRLRKMLEKKHLSVNLEKVRCVSGNVAEAQLGLEPQVWEELIQKVDGVIHCAALVNHTEYYVQKESNSDTRAVNIKGFKNVLEFASVGKLKRVCLASSFAAVNQVDEDGRISEDWPEIADFDGLTPFAYPVSKFVADYLTKEAVGRGIPCKVIRLPLIMGEKDTGRCEADANHALLRYLFMLKNGIMPDLPLALPMLPVDTCADLFLHLFFDEGKDSDVYNLLHSQPDLDQEFCTVANKLGFKLELVEQSEFTKRVKESRDNTLALFAEFYGDEEAILSHYAKWRVFQQWLEGNDKVWTSKKVPLIVPKVYESQRSTMDYVYSDLMFIKEQGLFNRFGL